VEIYNKFINALTQVPGTRVLQLCSKKALAGLAGAYFYAFNYKNVFKNIKELHKSLI